MVFVLDHPVLHRWIPAFAGMTTSPIFPGLAWNPAGQPWIRAFAGMIWLSLRFGVTGYGSKSSDSGASFFLGRPERPGWARRPIISVI